MKTVELNIKNPIIFSASNHYTAKTIYIDAVLERLTLNNSKFRPLCSWGEERDFWEDVKDLKIEISPYDLVWTWYSIVEEKTYTAGFSWSDDYRYCGDDSGMLDDEVMDFITQDAKGLQTATEISNM